MIDTKTESKLVRLNKSGFCFVCDDIEQDQLSANRFYYNSEKITYIEEELCALQLSISTIWKSPIIKSESIEFVLCVLKGQLHWVSKDMILGELNGS